MNEPKATDGTSDVRATIGNILLQACVKCSPWLDVPVQWDELHEDSKIVYLTQADALLAAFPALKQPTPSPEISHERE